MLDILVSIIPGGRRSLSAAGQMVQQKIPSISLGLPELPKGIRQTKPFTYSKKADLDFTLGMYIFIGIHIQ